MTSETTQAFRDLLAQLPPAVRARAKRDYQRWKRAPWHPSLQFKTIHQSLPIYSVRIGPNWRAIGIRKGDTIIWYWIGSHEEYNQKIKNLRHSQ